MYRGLQYVLLFSLSLLFSVCAEAGVKRLKLKKGETIKPAAMDTKTLKLHKMATPIVQTKVIKTKTRKTQVIEVAIDAPEVKPLKLKKVKGETIVPEKDLIPEGASQTALDAKATQLPATAKAAVLQPTSDDAKAELPKPAGGKKR